MQTCCCAGSERRRLLVRERLRRLRRRACASSPPPEASARNSAPRAPREPRRVDWEAGASRGGSRRRGGSLRQLRDRRRGDHVGLGLRAGVPSRRRRRRACAGADCRARRPRRPRARRTASIKLALLLDGRVLPRLVAGARLPSSGVVAAPHGAAPPAPARLTIVRTAADDAARSRAPRILILTFRSYVVEPSSGGRLTPPSASAGGGFSTACCAPTTVRARRHVARDDRARRRRWRRARATSPSTVAPAPKGAWPTSWSGSLAPSARAVAPSADAVVVGRGRPAEDRGRADDDAAWRGRASRRAHRRRRVDVDAEGRRASGSRAPRRSSAASTARAACRAARGRWRARGSP